MHFWRPPRKIGWVVAVTGQTGISRLEPGDLEFRLWYVLPSHLRASCPAYWLCTLSRMWLTEGPEAREVGRGAMWATSISNTPIILPLHLTKKPILILIRGHPELLIIVGISQIAPTFHSRKLNNQQLQVIITQVFSQIFSLNPPPSSSLHDNHRFTSCLQLWLFYNSI